MTCDRSEPALATLVFPFAAGGDCAALGNGAPNRPPERIRSGGRDRRLPGSRSDETVRQIATPAESRAQDLVSWPVSNHMAAAMMKPMPHESSFGSSFGAVRALLARLIVLVLAMALSAPFPALSADVMSHAGPAGVAAQSDPDRHGPPAPANDGVLSHAHCGCYQALPLQVTELAPLRRFAGADYFVGTNRLASLSSHPPRKPPRA